MVRLLTFAAADGPHTGALLPGDRVLDLGVGALDGRLGDLDALAASIDPGAESVPLADLALLPPVRPGKILCLGYNYRGHVPDGATNVDPDPVHPDVFVKTPNVLLGPNDPVPLPVVDADVDYEGEIAIVLGRTAKDVPLERAWEHVAGLTIFNDVSARDWQRRSSQWTLGKCFDGFGPLGPALVTLDEIADPSDLLVEVVRDGVVTVSQSTATCIFSMPFIVHHLSTVMTLHPGDVISTGTPQKLPGALAAHRPLAHGDAVTVRVTGLGELTTTFVDRERA